MYVLHQELMQLCLSLVVSLSLILILFVCHQLRYAGNYSITVESRWSGFSGRRKYIVNSVHCICVSLLLCLSFLSFCFCCLVSFFFVGCACCNCYALRLPSPSTIIMYTALHNQFQETKTTISRVHYRLHAQQLPLYIYLQRRMGKQECPKNQPIL